jgi:DNA polymerase-3 subunit gamma/tau
MYQALYRKYRPQTFEEVIGQEHITKTLSNQVKKGEISHAYLFSGSRGTGKTSVARIFAKAINCIDSKTGSPCYKCEVCKTLNEANNMDILEIDAASNNRVDEVREIREKVKFLPTSGKYKVYIIDEVHMLTDSAFNALLKTLEEPPAHIVFILGTTEPHKLPQTILSRCLRFDFKLISPINLKRHLTSIFDKEKINYEDDAIDLIVASAQGSVRDMLSIADSVVSFGQGVVTYANALNMLGATEQDKLFAFTDSVINKNTGKAFEEINTAVLGGINIAVFSKDVTVHFRNLLVVKTVKGNVDEILNMPPEVVKKLREQSQNVSEEELMFLMKTFSEIEAELKYTLSPRTLVEVATVKAIMGEDSSKKN